MNGVKFTQEFANRIVRAVKWVERQRASQTSARRPRSGIPLPALPLVVDTALTNTGGSDETANTDTWAIGAVPAGGAPPDGTLELTVCTRVAYDDEGDMKLYAFYRTLTFDLLGRLVAVTAEDRVIVDTPVECA